MDSCEHNMTHWPAIGRSHTSYPQYSIMLHFAFKNRPNYVQTRAGTGLHKLGYSTWVLTDEIYALFIPNTLRNLINISGMQEDVRNKSRQGAIAQV